MEGAQSFIALSRFLQRDILADDFNDVDALPYPVYGGFRDIQFIPGFFGMVLRNCKAIAKQLLIYFAAALQTISLLPRFTLSDE